MFKYELLLMHINNKSDCSLALSSLSSRGFTHMLIEPSYRPTRWTSQAVHKSRSICELMNDCINSDQSKKPDPFLQIRRGRYSGSPPTHLSLVKLSNQHNHIIERWRTKGTCVQELTNLPEASKRVALVSFSQMLRRRPRYVMACLTPFEEALLSKFICNIDRPQSDCIRFPFGNRPINFRGEPNAFQS
jgi:hypothetical protein